MEMLNVKRTDVKNPIEACLSLSLPALSRSSLSHLSDLFQRVTGYNRRRLHSSSLLIRPTWHITVGDRAFPVVGSRLWNSLAHVVTSAPTFAVFRNRLKTYLFSCSFMHWPTLIHRLVV